MIHVKLFRRNKLDQELNVSKMYRFRFVLFFVFNPSISNKRPSNYAVQWTEHKFVTACPSDIDNVFESLCSATYGFCEVVHSCRQLFAKLKNSCLFPHSSKVDDETISS